MLNGGEGVVAALQPALERCLTEAADLQVSHVFNQTCVHTDCTLPDTLT